MGAGGSIVALIEFLDGLGLVDASIAGGTELEVNALGVSGNVKISEAIVSDWEFTNAGILAAAGTGTVIGESIIGGMVEGG